MMERVPLRLLALEEPKVSVMVLPPAVFSKAGVRGVSHTRGFWRNDPQGPLDRMDGYGSTF